MPYRPQAPKTSWYQSVRSSATTESYYGAPVVAEKSETSDNVLSLCMCNAKGSFFFCRQGTTRLIAWWVQHVTWCSARPLSPTASKFPASSRPRVRVRTLNLGVPFHAPELGVTGDSVNGDLLAGTDARSHPETCPVRVFLTRCPSFSLWP